MDRTYLQETIVRDVIDVAQGLKDSDEYKAITNFRKGTTAGKSIAAKSEALTLVFPCVVDKSLSAKGAMLVAKAQERNCCNMLQMLFSAANITSAKNGLDYLKNFHSNLDLAGPSLGLDDLVRALDGALAEECMAKQVGTSEIEDYTRIRNEVMYEMNSYLPSADVVVEENSLLNYSINMHNGMQYVLNEAKGKKPGQSGGSIGDLLTSMGIDANDFSNIQTGDGKAYNTGASYASSYQLQTSMDVLRDYIDTNQKQVMDALSNTNSDNRKYLSRLSASQNNLEKQMRSIAKANPGTDTTKMFNQLQQEFDKYDKILKNIASKYPDVPYSPTRYISTRDMIETHRAAMDGFKAQMELEKNRFISTDVKKANELEPTLMFINFITVDKESSYPIYQSMVIGIKCRIYPVSSTEIVDKLSIKHTDRNLVLGFVKASTKEISFFKDFIWGIDKAKVDALSQSRLGSTSKLWKVLERRALKKRVMKGLLLKNDASPITTLVIAQETADYLKKTKYIDIENPNIIIPLMDAYNLMSIVIVDEGLETTKFIFDSGDDTYQMLTFDALEREERNTDRKFMNLISKIR